MDLLMLQAVLREWREWLPGGRASKVTQPASSVVVLSVRGPAWVGHLLLSVEPGSPRAHATEEAFESPPHPPLFCQALRRALGGRRLGSPSLVGGDRVVALPFLRTGPGEGPEEVTLVAELTGQQAALVLIDGSAAEGTISFVLKPGVASKRLTRKGPYAPPAWPEGAAGLEDYTAASLAQALSDPAMASRPVERRLLRAVMGLSPLAAMEICHRAGVEVDSEVVEPDQALSLLEAAAALSDAVTDGPLSPVLYRDSAGYPLAATPVAYSHLEAVARAEPLPTANAAAAALAEARTESQRAVQLRQRLFGVVDRALKKIERTREKVQEEVDRGRRADLNRQYGELLLANLNSLRRGMTSVTLRNDFDPDGVDVTIALDPAVSPKINAARYFKRSKKGRRSQPTLEKRLATFQSEAAYLEATRSEAARADEETVEGLLEELAAAGFGPWTPKPPPRRRPRRRSREASVRRYRVSEDWSLYVGKNARGNDELTTRIARPADLWFHAQGMPGAHVVLRSDGRAEPPAEAVGWAAATAAYFSRGRGNAKVKVDYAETKNVTKPKGAKPGQVVIRRKKTIIVAPAAAERLREMEEGAGGRD